MLESLPPTKAKKLRDMFDDTKKCEKLASIYLKLHTKKLQYKYKSQGRVVTEDAYN